LSTQREDVTYLFDSVSDIEIITFYETMQVRALGKVKTNLLFTLKILHVICLANAAWRYVKCSHRGAQGRMGECVETNNLFRNLIADVIAVGDRLIF
jgi:hypothetical protein